MESENINFCACMGPQGTDEYCPCQMRQKGLLSTMTAWTEDDSLRLSKAIDRLRERALSKETKLAE